MAPWTHTYLSPQLERRMCCTSRESAQNFKQYIDTENGTGEFRPMTLDQHWNSEHMRSVRRRMMAGETLPECAVCNNRLLNIDVYRDYFWRLFGHLYSEIWNCTAPDGTTSMQPRSWDYRFSNLCNFKCRMCGDMLSSSWETEERVNNQINWRDPKNNWMLPDVRQQISAFQSDQVEKEFSTAVEEHRVEEIYWVGGEPLMFDQHWRYMSRIIELGDGNRIYARYNTNLSRITYQNLDLYTDILEKIRDWQICASIDGTGAIGEYIRTGLNWEKFVDNYKRGMAIERYPGQMRLDFTLTLPGLFEVVPMVEFAKSLNTRLLTKVMFAFGPEVIMSPLSLPRKLLEKKCQALLKEIPAGTMHDMLTNLMQRATHQEAWPDRYENGLRRGKKYVQIIENIRQDKYRLEDILKLDDDIYEWWNDIDETQWVDEHGS